MRHYLLAAFVSVMSSRLQMTMLLAQTQAAGRNSALPATIEALRDRYRPLLVFAPTDKDERFLQQARLFAAGSSRLHERQVLFVPVVLRSDANHGGVMLNSSDVASLDAKEANKIRQRLHISAEGFTVVLLGKDGGEKLRAHTPVTIERLNALIDAMPMRQQEIRNGHSK